MANIRIRPNNIIQYDFFVMGKRFRETSGMPATSTNLKKAKAVLKKLEAAIALEQLDYRQFFPDSPKIEVYEKHLRLKQATNAVPYFDDYWHKWFELHQHEWSQTYCNDLKRAFSHHLKPRFGNTIVSEIQYSDALAFRSELAETSSRKQPNGKLSPARINSIILHLTRVIREASIDYGFAYPFEHLKRLRTERSAPKPLSKDEVAQFMKTVPEDWYDYFLIRFYTGMRSCEIHGLRHQDIDFEHNLIGIRQNWVAGQTSRPKTAGSNRDIQMIQPVRQAFERACAKTKASNDYVFVCPKGKPLDSRNVSRIIWEPTLKRAGLTRRTLHQTRHTAAILHLAARENPRYISQLLGHSNGQMLFQAYAPYVRNATQEDGQAFARMMTETDRSSY